jgi:phenylacetate-CoA ligase
MNKTARPLEFSSKRTIESSQTQLLRETVQYVATHSRFYKNALAKKGVNFKSIRSSKDLSLLPMTKKEDLQAGSESFFCVEKKDFADIVSTTGTTGEPVFIVLTKADLARLAQNEVYSFSCAGVTPEDTIHLAVTLDNLFMAGIAYYSGIVGLGASVYRVGMHNADRQILLLRQLKPTGIMTVPSFLLRLGQAMKAQNVRPKSLSVKRAILVGESIRDREFHLSGIGELLQKTWPLDFYSTFGNSETAISFCECEHKRGAHEHSEFIMTEILDEYGDPVPDGEPGELVLTTLQVQGLPLLRYATGDITFKITEPCRCGRNSSRIGPVLGRKANMLKYKGTKVYPKVIEGALARISGVSNYVIEAFTGDDCSDKIVVKVGCDKPRKTLAGDITSKIFAHARVTPEVKLVSAEEVAALQSDYGRSRKFKTFIDHRA